MKKRKPSPEAQRQRKEVRVLLGKNMLAARKRAALSQDEVAADFGITRQNVGMYEKGRSAPNAADIPRLAKILKTTVGQLFGLSNLGPTEQRAPLLDPEALVQLQVALEAALAALVGRAGTGGRKSS